MDIDNIDDIIASYEPTERTTRICLKGSLVAEFEELEEKLKDARRDSTRLSEVPEAWRIAERMKTLREEMLATAATFRFRAIGDRYSQLFAAHAKDGQITDGAAFATALIVACCISPTLSPDKLAALKVKINNAQFQELYDTALACNRSSVDVPFSTLVSDVLRSNEQS